jgi:hypothetical protein
VVADDDDLTNGVRETALQKLSRVDRETIWLIRAEL